MTKSKARFPGNARQDLDAGDSLSLASAFKPPGAAAATDVEGTPVQVAPFSVAEPGKLGNATEGSMRLHTREALRVFSGRAANAQARVAPLPGGRHFAAALKSIWYLSGADNPYADCILIRVYDGLATLRARVAELTAAREATLAQLRRKGLMFEVLESARPVTVALGFRSPYGFAIAEAILEFDYYVRLVQTLVQKDRLSDVDGVTEIRSLSHSLFVLFYKATRWERLLLRGELQHLSRGDFKPDASAEAQQRVTAAAALFGKLPRNILLGSEQPRHSRRRVSVRATDQGAVPQPLPSTAVMISPDAAVDATVATDEPHSGTASTVFANVSRETPEATMPPASGAL